MIHYVEPLQIKRKHNQHIPHNSMHETIVRACEKWKESKAFGSEQLITKIIFVVGCKCEPLETRHAEIG